MEEKRLLIEEEDIDVIRMSLETICQMAGDRKTGNGFEMQPTEALDEIRVKAKDALEYIDMFLEQSSKLIESTYPQHSRKQEYR